MAAIKIGNLKDIEDPVLRAKLEAAAAAQAAKEVAEKGQEQSAVEPSPAAAAEPAPPQAPVASSPLPSSSPDPAGNPKATALPSRAARHILPPPPPEGPSWRIRPVHIAAAIAAAVVLAAGLGAYVGIQRLATVVAPAPFNPERIDAAPTAPRPAEQSAVAIIPAPAAAPSRIPQAPAPAPASVTEKPASAAVTPAPAPSPGPVTQPSSPAAAYGPRPAQPAPAAAVPPQPQQDWGQPVGAPPGHRPVYGVTPCSAKHPDGKCIPVSGDIYGTTVLWYPCTSIVGNQIGGAGWTRGPVDCAAMLASFGEVMYTGSTPARGRVCPQPITGQVTVWGNRIQLAIGVEAPGLGVQRISGLIDTGASQTSFPDDWLRGRGFKPVSGPISVSGVGPTAARGWIYEIPFPKVNSNGGWVPLGAGTLRVTGIEGGLLRDPLIGPDALRAARLQLDGRNWTLTPPCY